MNSAHDFESIINLPFQSDEKGDYPMESVILHLLKVSGFSYVEIVKALDNLDFPIYRISEAEYLYLLVYLDCDLMEFIEGYDIRKPLYKRERNFSNSMRAEKS